MREKLLLYVRRLPLRIVVGAALGLLIILSVFRGCRAPVNSIAVDLAPNDPNILEVNISPKRVISVRTQEGATARYVPSDGAATVTVDQTGTVDISVQSAGLSFKPGMAFIVTNKLRLGLDVQVAYWNRLEAHIGLGGPAVIGYVGLGYRLDSIGLNNTSVQAVITTDRHIGGALSVRF
jgi:hypothetical protein